MPNIIKIDRLKEDDPRPTPANVMIVFVGTNTLRPAPWNPEQRMRKGTLAPLIRRIEEEGFDPFRPILISKDGYIGDGHRRWRAAQELMIDQVPVVFTDRSVEDLWAGNAGARPVSAREWLAVSVIAGVETPARLKSLIDEMRPVLGDEGLRYLIERQVAPSIWRIAWRIGIHCKRHDHKFLRSAVYWLIKHKMSDAVSKAMRGSEFADPIDPRLLIQFVESDLPLKMAWAFDQALP